MPLFDLLAPQRLTEVVDIGANPIDGVVLLFGCDKTTPALLMGADGGTIASSGVVPEVVMKLYRESVAGNIAEARRIQLKFLDLINAMLTGTNFPEGFRAGMSLRGFNLGTSRQLLSPREQGDLEEIRGKIACILAECGFAEAAGACRVSARSATPESGGRVNLDEVVRSVMQSLQRK